MKAFIISLITVVGIFVLTLLNSIFIEDLTSSLIEDAVDLSLSDQSVQQLCDKWKSIKAFINITSSHDETHRIDEALAVLLEKSNSEIEGGFYEERQLLIEYLKQIKEDEGISFDSII